MSHVGLSLTSVSVSTHDNNDKPHRLVVALSASTTTMVMHVQSSNGCSAQNNKTKLTETSLGVYATAET